MDIKEVKDEIKKDEELLVKVFQLEKFVRKYKKIIITTAVILILFLIGQQAYSAYKAHELKQANLALETLLANPNDKEALATLKKDRKLYDLYLLKRGDFKDIQTKELEGIKAYELAMKKGTVEALENYINNPNYTLLKNAARVALIKLYLQKGEHQKAVNVANQIMPNSRFKEIAQYLIHYGIVK